MKKTLAFDVYGTLIDTNGVTSTLETMMVDKGQLFAETWRTKQLEYSFRRGLMRSYASFSVCTNDALSYTCEYLKIPLTNQQRSQLIECYQRLPAFTDVIDGLSQLKQDYNLIAFSNGTKDSVNNLLVTAGIGQYFEQIISADEIQTFKPNPDIYQYLLTKSGSNSASTWLISSNPFDVIGAKSFGLKAAWVKRNDNAIYDPWGLEPDITIGKLDELVTQLTLY